VGRRVGPGVGWWSFLVPVLTPEEVRAVDRASSDPVEVLVARAGGAVARAALSLLGGAYGRRVVVVAGKGNNGADGRVAAERLARRGVATLVVDAASAPDRLPSCDLVIDAAYGTGFSGDYAAPDPGAAPVLAVDIPSGVDGLTGAAGDGAVQAARTVTFAALKPGLVLLPGMAHAGDVEVADIGLDASRACCWMVEASDVAAWLPARPRAAHKWASPVWVVAGSPGLTGAATLCAGGALRAGAGTVRVSVPGGALLSEPVEAVGRPLPAEGWPEVLLGQLDRFRVLVVGPGLGRAEGTRSGVRRLVADAPLPVLVDADGLWALGTAEEAAEVIRVRRHPTVLTPHDGELARLRGGDPRPGRIGDTVAVAVRTGATVLRKGPTTIVAEPGGSVLLSVGGADARLATSGTGDVLAGIIGAFLAMGMDTLQAAAAGAFVHSRAATLGPAAGLLAGDLPGLLPGALASLRAEAAVGPG